MCLQHYCCYVSATSFCYVCYIFSSTVFHSLSSFSLCLSQFEDFVMDICFEILDNSKNALKNLAKDIERRCDPIYVSRMITTMVTVSSKQLTQKLRIWASFMFSLCNSYTYFHSITSYVTAKIPASQLIFYPHLMCQNTSDIFFFFYIYIVFNIMYDLQRYLHDMLYLPYRWTQTVTGAYLPVSGMSLTMTASHLIGGLAVYQSSDSGAKLGRGQSNMASAGCWLVLPAQVRPSQPFYFPHLVQWFSK